MDAARTLDYPNFVAGSLTTPPGQDVPDMSGPTCCRGLAFIAADFMYDELRQLNPVQELHRRFWSLMTAGSSLTGSIFFSCVAVRAFGRTGRASRVAGLHFDVFPRPDRGLHELFAVARGQA